MWWYWIIDRKCTVSWEYRWTGTGSRQWRSSWPRASRTRRVDCVETTTRIRTMTGGWDRSVMSLGKSWVHYTWLHEEIWLCFEFFVSWDISSNLHFVKRVLEFEIVQGSTVEAFRVYLVLCYCRNFGCFIEPCYDLLL